MTVGESGVGLLTAMKQVTHVIFDLDGLLINSEDLYEKVYTKVLQSHGKDFDWNLRKSICGRQQSDGHAMIIESLNLPITIEQFNNEVKDEQIKVLPEADLMPGAARLLKHLHKHRIPMAVASSSSKDSFAVKLAKLERQINFSSLFHHILLGPDNPRVKCGKPAPDIYLVCRDMFPKKRDGSQDPKSSFLVFEDSVAGVMAGLRAGMQVVMVPDPRLNLGEVHREHFEFKPTLAIPSLANFDPVAFGLPDYDDG